MKKLISVFLICALLIPTFSVMPAMAYGDLPFTDIAVTHTSGYLNVKALWEKGIISGKSETEFAPNDPLTREEAAKIIVLATGTELTQNRGSFADVVPGSWYEPYVETASEHGIVNGIGDSLFGVGTEITRQDAVVLISRMAESMGIEIERLYQATNPTDLAKVADYAKDSVIDMIQFSAAKLIDGEFKPEEPITRMHFCQYLDRVLISDPGYYDDIYSEWIPEEKDISEYNKLTIAYEDFENGISTLSDYDARWSAGKHTTDYITSDMGKDSKHSLVLNGPSGTYCNLYMYDPTPGAEYYVRYDIKTENLGDNFFRVNYEWYNSEKTNLKGGYNGKNDLKGEHDWTEQTHSVVAPTPDLEPQCLRLYFSIRGTTDAKVWIDNFEIYKVVKIPLRSYLKSPAYKGIITNPNGESDIRVTTYITGLGDMLDAEKTKLSASISDLEGNVLLSSEHVAPTEEMDVTFSSKSLEIGDYHLALKLMDTETGKVHGENNYILRKREPDFETKYSYDEYGRMLKNGKPEFLLGTYSRGIQEDHIKEYADTPFDFIISNSVSQYWTNYDLLDDWAEKADMSSVLSTESVYKDAIRSQYRNPDVTNIASERVVLERMIDDLDLTNKETHMGYHINNESGYDIWMDRMAWTTQYLSEKDLDHPTIGVNGGNKGDAIGYAPMHDIYFTESYPITGADTDQIWNAYKNTKNTADGTFNRPFFTVLQISDLKVMGTAPYIYRERGPNEEELRNMAWQAVCGGASGLVWYAHFHLYAEGVSRPYEETWPEIVGINEEIAKFEDVILSREDAPDVYATADIPEHFAHTTRRYDGKTYVILVNSDFSSQTVSVKLEDPSSIFGVYGNKEYVASEDGYVDLALEPRGVEILIVDQPEPKSYDCKLSNVHFSNGEKNYFVSVTEGDNELTVAECAQEINYNAAIHKDATLKINGEIVPRKGTYSLNGVDKLTLTVISEDGDHEADYVYNIVRKPKEE